MTFREPDYLWLLVVPTALVALAIWRLARRRRDIALLRARRIVPARQRFAWAGDVPFWITVALAAAGFIVALARPSASSQTLRRAGVDVVVLQDASASMHVMDTPGGRSRWQRSTQFLRRLGDALSWREDRIALAAFAHIAAPQIRLTRDPNTLFFFLDHLSQRPPFRLDDATTWDTNLELGIYWGVRLIEKDEEIHGRSPNAKLFIMLSDGESWSGEVAKSIDLAVSKNFPVFVIGVGTQSGGKMPVVPGLDAEEAPEDRPPLVSRLDRPALQRIASEGRGRYYELDRSPDGEIANAIVDTGRRLAPAIGSVEEYTDLYWWALYASAGVLALGLLFVRETGALLVLLGAAAAAAAALQKILF